jgi:thiopeptide-type bacteriocin biosynthesis protein
MTGSLYQALDWAMIRAPLLPVEKYLQLARQEGVDRQSQTSALLQEPTVSTALAVGSLELARALERRTKSGRDLLKQQRKLLRYLIRMSTRPTPYGLFAAVGLITWKNDTCTAIGDMPLRTRTRPDMNWLVTLIMQLEGDPEVRRQISWVANPALIRAGRVFLPERAPTADGSAKPPSVSVRATSAVARVLSCARRPVEHARLEAELLQTPGATTEKVARLLDELWQQTLLLSDLRPPLTNPDPGGWLLDRLSSVPAAQPVREKLKLVLDATRNWDALPLAERAAGYRQLVDLATELHSCSDNEPPVQVDTALALKSNWISALVAAEAERTAELLIRLTPSPRSSYLDAYRAAFHTRYGTDREVPLLELLDPNFGLGQPTGHGWAGGGGDARRSMLRNSTLQELALTAFRDRRLTVVLDDQTLSKLALWEPDAARVPGSVDLSLFVAASSAAALDRGDFLVVVGPNLGGTAAGKNLGRFADLLEPDGTLALTSLAQLEALRRPGPLRVEVVYLPPRFRSANVVLRPPVREYEIVSGTSPGVSVDRVVPLDELVVGVRAGRFYIRWPTAGVDIAACSGHMLNYNTAPAPLRFLEDVMQDGQAQISSFNWGPAAGFPFLPRVQSGRVVLSLAQWRIDLHLRDTALWCEPASAFAAVLDGWRTHWAVPRYVYLSMGDNRLLLDLDDPDQAEELRVELAQLREGSMLLLQEALPGPDDAWLPGPGGHHLSELVVPLVVRTAAEPPEISRAAASGVAREVAADLRLRPPGSDWLFIKLYCPRALEEDLIAGPVRTFCGAVIAAGLATSWFFIRYADPDQHLRIRFKGESKALLGQLMPQLCAWAEELMADGYCQRFALDTYDREVERFGGADGIGIAEAIFAADSQACAELLYLIGQGSRSFDRTTLAVLSCDGLLADLRQSLLARGDLYRAWVPATPDNGRVYRQYQATLRRLLGDPNELARLPGGAELSLVLRRRQRGLADTAIRLDELSQRGGLTQPTAAFLRSCVHLMHNRLVGANPPAEDVVLGLLRRTRDGLDRGPLLRTAPASLIGAAVY